MTRLQDSLLPAPAEPLGGAVMFRKELFRLLVHSILLNDRPALAGGRLRLTVGTACWGGEAVTVQELP